MSEDQKLSSQTAIFTERGTDGWWRFSKTGSAIAVPWWLFPVGWVWIRWPNRSKGETV